MIEWLKRVSSCMVLAAPCLLSTVLPRCAHAAWPTDPAVNVAVCDTVWQQMNPEVVSDGQGGVFVFWNDDRSASSYELYGQHLTSTATKLWTTQGIPLASQTFLIPRPLAALSDGSGGAFVVYSNNAPDLYAQHVSSSGTLLWGANGVVVSNEANHQENASIVSDGAGGFVVAWADGRNGNSDIYAQRFNSAGTRIWPANGVLICNAAGYQFSPLVASDGAGGAIVAWQDQRVAFNDDVYARRISSTGVVSWTVNGVQLSSLPTSEGPTGIVADGSGGAIVLWDDSFGSILARRVNSAGTSVWGPASVSADVAFPGGVSRMASDGAGGVIVAWTDFRENPIHVVYAQRIGPTGAKLWPSDVRAVDGVVATSHARPAVCTDGSGGAILVWTLDAAPNRMYGQRLGPTGTRRWASGGLQIASAGGNINLVPAISPHLTGGAIVAWEDSRNTTPNMAPDIYAHQAASAPATPLSCTAGIVNSPASKGVQLNWNDVTDEAGYRVYRDGLLLATLGPDVTQLLDHEYPVRGDVQYCVESFNPFGASAPCCQSASNTLITSVEVAGPDWYQDTFPWDETPGPAGIAALPTKPARVASGRNVAPLAGNVNRFDIPQGWARLRANVPVLRVDLIFRIQPGPGNYNAVGNRSSGLIPLPDVTRPAAVIAPGDGSYWSGYIAFNGALGTGSPGTNGVPHHPGSNWELRWDPNTWNSAECALVGGYYITNRADAPATKIIPDDLLTPGAHVQYFFRVHTMTGVVLVPDTSRVLQPDGERSIDGHRWAEFSVLPDLWKDPANGGPGLARTLVIDLCDGHGAERIWTGIADTSGATAAARYGANNGWHAIGGGADIDLAANNRLSDNLTPGFTAAHLGSAGTTWDLYSVRGPDDLLNGQAGSIGSRLAPRPGPADPDFGKESRQGPTPEVLKTFYRQLIIFTGDRHQGILGPFNDRGQNDLAILNDFLMSSGGTPMPRGLYVSGEGFVECEFAPGLPASHRTFVQSTLGTTLRSPDYRTLSGNSNSAALLFTAGPHTAAQFDAQLNGDPDVLNGNPSFFEAVGAAYWENFGDNGPYVASVYKAAVPVRNWVSLVDGWNLARLGAGRGFTCIGCLSAQRSSGHFGADRAQNALSRLSYVDETLDELFGGVTQITDPGSPLGSPLAIPTQASLSVVGNPVVGGHARIRLELPTAEHVRVEIVDVAGRRLRSIADQRFDAGRWILEWDGADAAGHRIGPGVYFVRLARDGGPVKGGVRMVLLR